MHRLWWMGALLLAWMFPFLMGMTGLQARAQRVDVPPSGQWVTDLGGLLSPVEEQTLAQTLRFYADTTSTQIVIVTLPDLGGEDIALYATELGQQWGVGQQGQDNGVVIVVSRDDREVFIATGYGLEGSIPDVVASRIVREIVLPNFKQGRFYAGLTGAVDALIQAAAGEFTVETPPSSYGPQQDGEDFSGLLFIVFIVVYVIVSSMRRRGGGGGGHYHRRRGGLPVVIWGGGGFSGGGGFGGGGFGGGGFGGGGAGGSW